MRILAALLIAASLHAQSRAPEIDSIKRDEMKADLFFLASDEMRGRLTNTPEYKLASEWIISRFQRLGLLPAGDAGEFYQEFELIYGRLGDGNRLVVGEGPSRRTARLREEFYPLLQSANGGFYFSDPGDSSRENLIGTVHYVDKAGKTHLVDKGLAFPNGIVLSPDGKKLYLAESQYNRVFVYEVKGPGKVGERKLFADLPKHESGDYMQAQPDGMCLDATGNLYVAHYGMKKVEVLSPSGKLIRQYDGGNTTTSNVAFGGPKHDQLFITGGIGKEAGEGGLFRIDLGAKGLVILPAAKKGR